MQVTTVIHIPSGKSVKVYRHKERPVFVNATNYTTEYPKQDIRE